MTLSAKRKRIAVTATRLTLIATAIVMIALPTPSHALEPVTVGYFGSDATLATFVAKEEGFFEKHGIDATVKQMSGVSTAAALALVAGSVQVISASFPTAVLAAEQGLDVKILAGTTISPAPMSRRWSYGPILRSRPRRMSRATRSGSPASTTSCMC
jgi:ABC-type nitrate/sulfonate/bicarbonate transport system substrate-binding protein